jgi:hypothetical protein
LTYSETSPSSHTLCTSGSTTRCDPSFVAWLSTPAPTLTQTGGTTLVPPFILPNPTPCTVPAGGNQISCSLLMVSSKGGSAAITFTLTASAQNVGMALRKFDSTTTMGNVSTSGRSVTGVLNTDGSASVTLNGTTSFAAGSTVSSATCTSAATSAGLTLTPGTFGANDCYSIAVTVPITLLADHPILSSTDATYGWFVRNKWHEVSYYAVASGIAPSGARSCATSTTCLQVTYHPNDGKQRGLIVIAGRRLAGQTRPPAAVSDLLEGTNADGDVTFALRSATLIVNRTFNDRIAVIDSN